MSALPRVAFVLLVSATLWGNHALGGDAPGAGTRPFLLGFTRWPDDLTLEGFLTAQDFAHQHGGIVSVMFIGGVPWPELLDGKPKPALATWDAWLQAKYQRSRP